MLQKKIDLANGIHDENYSSPEWHSYLDGFMSIESIEHQIRVLEGDVTGTPLFDEGSAAFAFADILFLGLLLNMALHGDTN